MTCPPCRERHERLTCLDTITGGDYPHRYCACQHRRPVGG